MANGHHLTLIISLLILQLAFPLLTAKAAAPKPAPVAKPAPKNIDVVVEGMVYCQNCARKGMWSLTGAKPLANATISVICKDRRNRVIFYKAFDTNKDGYFYAQLKGFKVNNPFLDHPLQTCRVKLVSSKVVDCDTLTNVNYGIMGAPLRYQDQRVVGRGYEAVVFAAGPLAFRPDTCPQKGH